MKTKADTAARVRNWVMDTFPLAQEREVGMHDSLLEGGIIDSLGTLEVVEYLEREFEIHVTDDEMLAEHFDTVQAIVEFIDSKQQQSVQAEAY